MEQKKFLKLYWKRYEIDLINYCLRIVFNHYDMPFDIEYKKVFFDKYSQISIDKLITSRNVEELIDNLKGTEYYSPLALKLYMGFIIFSISAVSAILSTISSIFL